MASFEEKRDSLRVDVSCDLYIKKFGFEESRVVTCVNLSCTGVSFIADSDFKIGDEMVLHLKTDCKALPETSFRIRIVRCEAGEDGLYVIGALIIFQDQ